MYIFTRTHIWMQQKDLMQTGLSSPPLVTLKHQTLFSTGLKEVRGKNPKSVDRFTISTQLQQQAAQQ